VSRIYKTEGIILKRVNFGEADRILTIFSKHYGKIKAIAKGVRKISSKKGGNVEVFNHVVSLLSEAKNLDIITEAAVIQSFENLRKDLKKVGLAFQIVEAVDSLTAEKEANQRVFELLKNSLRRLNQGVVLNQEIVVQFEVELLRELGFGLPKEISKKSVENFIEAIIEKKLKSKKIFPVFPDHRSG
jgi:DNA repair protein RecO (recombination protein O)